jgi:hypothetical protein
MTQQLAHAASSSEIPWMVLLPAVVSCTAHRFFRCQYCLSDWWGAAVSPCSFFLFWSLNYILFCRWAANGTSLDVWLHLRHCSTNSCFHPFNELLFLLIITIFFYFWSEISSFMPIQYDFNCTQTAFPKYLKLTSFFPYFLCFSCLCFFVITCQFKSNLFRQLFDYGLQNV